MSVEPRYNLATKVMSNGVEVIVAGDRNTRPGEPEYLRLLSSTVTRPITLAPHTLSQHMSMLLPADLQSHNEVEQSLNPSESLSKAVITTTYIFPTKVVQGSTTTTILEKAVVTNTMEVNLKERVETSSQEISLSTSPEFQTEIHKTVYTYWNTVLDGEQPLVATSRRTAINTLTAAIMDTTNTLEPSEVFPETNTYYATKEFTRTLTDGTDSQVISNTEVVTQVVVTDPPEKETLGSDQGTIDVTKTYFVTYTYFSTYIEDDETRVTSHVSVSSDVTVEKFFANAKRTLMITPTPAPLSIIATKILTSSQVDDSENVAAQDKLTETLTADKFPSGYLNELSKKVSENDGPIETSAVLDDGEKVGITAFDGDIIDEWYEKFKIKPTTELEITKTRPKTKTTLKFKSKSKVKPQSLSPTSSTSSAAMLTTALASEKVVIHNDHGNKTLIPLSDPDKKPLKNDSTVQVSDMLSLGALGINSINVLGPVFNAMADLLKNHQKEALKRRNDTFPSKKTSPPSIQSHFANNVKPALNHDHKPKSTTSRTPVYIPVGSFADDTETSESEGRVSILPHPDKHIQEKWPSGPPKLLEKNRRTHDTNPIPLLEGGIPISPGQIITTNSDVIIGRPSDSGPRPPNFAVKNNVPVDMKPPPPVEETRVHLEPIGQFSTNQGVQPGVGRPPDGVDMKPPPLPPSKPVRPVKGPPHHHHHHPHDSGAMDLNPPPPPPSFVRPQNIVPIPVHLNPDDIIENYVNPQELPSDSLAVPNEMFPTPSIPREVSKFIERSSGQPLLVNIQPSQVAQVVIPHGSSTALIISDEQQHSTKGEVIDDPSPHPEPETVGFVGAEPVLKIENSEIPSSHNIISEILKADMAEPHRRPTITGVPIDVVNVRPRPDYDNIGMRPPNAPIIPQNNQKKDPSGIYVDISPPGHLPPPPKLNIPPGMQHIPHIPMQDNMDNHQLGVVNDVPLNVQVQLGSGTTSDAPIKEVHVSITEEAYHPTPERDETLNFIHRPINADPEDLSPPPLPRPSRPLPPSHGPAVSQKPMLNKPPKYPMLPEPPDFMIPPPRSEVVKPTGAGSTMGQKPGRPGGMMVIQQPDYNNEYADSDDPLETEDGEEIQESNSRPLFPGQLPSEIENLLKNQTSLSNIGVSQTLSFGGKNDKADENNAPGVREPETIMGSQIPLPNGNGFNNNNEAVVSVGNKPNLMDSGEFMMNEAEKIFGMKMPQSQSKGTSQVIAAQMKPNEINEILMPPKPDEVMGMAPPPASPQPRPPERAPRPKPPPKFEMHSPVNHPVVPINMENDFPPVRSPELIKKPFKPENVFPPRLPENFIHHEHDQATHRPPPRPVVTSMPIDSPDESTTENASAVNLKPQQVKYNSTVSKPKPVIYERPPNVHTQRPTSRPMSDSNILAQRPTSRPVSDSRDHSKLTPQASRDTPIRTPPTSQDSSKYPTRGQASSQDSSKRDHPFPFEPTNPQGDSFSSYGEKVRKPPQLPLPNRNPPTRVQPTRTPPTGSNVPPTYEQPPPRVQVPSTFEQPPPPRGRPPSSIKNNQPNQFESNRPTIPFERPPQRQPPQPSGRPPQEHGQFSHPPKRVEPSPHFEGRPAQGAPPSKPQPAQSDTTGGRKPPVYQKPPPRENHQTFIDQVPQPTSTYNRPKDNILRNVSKDHLASNIPQGTIPLRPANNANNTPTPSRGPIRARPSNNQPSPPVLKPSEVGQSFVETVRPTPTSEVKGDIKTNIKSNIVTTMVTSGSTTIFGDLYTDPLVIQPSRIVPSNNGVQFSSGVFANYPINSAPPEKIVVVSSIFPTHATTLTVTSTMTTVLHHAGQTPVTRTVLLTTTIISTIVDKVTETETLVKPTTSTITQTHTISTTKTALVVPTAIYPPRHNYQPKPEIFVTEPHSNRPKPEIFVADPHEKPAKPEIFVADPRDKDTMTISVSSSMSKSDQKTHKDSADSGSILVVVTDKPPSADDKNEEDVLFAGVLSSSPTFPKTGSSNECLPECRPTRNELCVKQDGLMKCVCRPGFARMFLDRPCKPTYTYSIQLALDRMGGDVVQYQNGLQVAGSPKYVQMSEATKEGLNRMVMQSDLRDIYHGVAINGFQPKEKKTMVNFYVQLSENVDENKVLGVFKKSLRTSNFSLGGTEMFAAREGDNLQIQDFNECLNSKFHDCSEHARCFNLKGTYTCSCKEGYTDVSENQLYPGRMCSDMIGCEYCGYHGTCFVRNEQQTCECFQWYTGDRCRINLKVLLIALVTIGAILLALLLVCVIMTCLKRRSTTTSHSNGSTGYLRYRGPSQPLDKRAMIVDTSSESSVENLPYVNPPPPPPPPQITLAAPRKPVLRQIKRPAPKPQAVPVEQRDRSLTVMIPRVKYRAVPPLSPHLSMSTFSPDKHLSRTAAQVATEQKLLNYLDSGQREGPGPSSQRASREEKRIYDTKPAVSATKKEPRVFEYEYKTSNMHITDCTSSGERRSKDDRFRRYSDQTPLQNESNNAQHRKYSAGALVSAGYAVSATGGLIQDIEESTIQSNTLKSSRSQFTTLNRSGDHKTMSEARSYDETMIHPQTRPLCTNYSGSSSSRLNNDENHTMVERDLGSTFLLPESHLFKPAGDRGSDISNFDSL